MITRSYFCALCTCYDNCFHFKFTIENGLQETKNNRKINHDFSNCDRPVRSVVKTVLSVRVIHKSILDDDDDDAIIGCCPHLIKVARLTSWKWHALSLSRFSSIASISFKFRFRRVGQIKHSVASGSPPLRHYFGSMSPFA